MLRFPDIVPFDCGEKLSVIVQLMPLARLFGANGHPLLAIPKSLGAPSVSFDMYNGLALTFVTVSFSWSEYPIAAANVTGAGAYQATAFELGAVPVPVKVATCGLVLAIAPIASKIAVAEIAPRNLFKSASPLLRHKQIRNCRNPKRTG